MGNPTSQDRMKRLAALAAMMVASAAISGCGIGAGTGPTPVQGAALRGSIHGGQQPVSGSSVQLYVAGSTGYGSSGGGLLSPAVVSDAGGGFSITNKYTCPSAGSQVYIVATGGNSGFSNNSNLALMAALGPCGSLPSVPFIFINELTTVASVWALSPFMTGIANVGSSASNTTGIVNAFADVNTLVDIGQGSVPGPALPAGATVPTAEMNTLGDIIAACINSAGGVAGDGSACGNMFSATGSGGIFPTDTITAALKIAQRPGINVAALFALVTPAAPFQPTISQPNDFTIAVNYTGGSINAPTALASDASGNVWVANGGNNTVTELAHTGSVMSGGGFTFALNLPSSIAIDSTGNAWVTNKGNNTISRFSAAGAPIGAPLTAGGLNQPRSIAFDSLGNAWIANAGNASVSKFTSAGTAVSGASGFTGAGIVSPVGIVVSPH